jgi:hypothetical protein
MPTRTSGPRSRTTVSDRIEAFGFIIELPEPTEQELVLEPNLRATRGLRGTGDEPPSPALEPQRQRLSIGEPVFRRVGVESTDDVELRRFLEEEDDYDFYRGMLTCTLRQDDDEARFAAAVLGVDLGTVEAGPSPPIAWSMEPLRSFDAVPVTRSVRFGPSLELFGVGLDAGAEAGSQRERKEIFVEGLYERESTPAWRLYRTESTPLQGGQRFDLVVRAPKGTTTLGTVGLSATVEWKRFGLVAYRARLPGQPELEFRLSREHAEPARVASGL